MLGKMKKASKGKRGCLTRAGKLKKGFRWAKRRKGMCIAIKKKKATKKKPAKKKTAKKRAPRRRALPPLPPHVTAAILTAPGERTKYEQRGAFTEEELKSFGGF